MNPEVFLVKCANSDGIKNGADADIAIILIMLEKYPLTCVSKNGYNIHINNYMSSIFVLVKVTHYYIKCLTHGSNIDIFLFQIMMLSLN